MSKTLRERVRAGESLLGCFLNLHSPDLVEVLGLCGLDYVILDMEHGLLGIAELVDLIRAAELAGLSTIVRVQGTDLFQIGHVLDAGAQGVMVPRLRSAADVARVAEAARFAPRGNRGLASSVRACRYGFGKPAQFALDSNESALVLVQVETKEALAQLESFLEVAEVDGIFIGPLDLSQALGITGQVGDPQLIGTMERIVQAARAKNVPVGTVTPSQESVQLWSKAGVQLFTITLGQMFVPYANFVSTLRTVIN